VTLYDDCKQRNMHVCIYDIYINCFPCTYSYTGQYHYSSGMWADDHFIYSACRLCFYQWYRSLGQLAVHLGLTGSVSNGTTLTPTYTFSPADISSGATVTLTMSVSNSPCTAATTTFTLTINQVPSVATAAGLLNVCGSLTSGSLGGNTPTVGTGTWSLTSGPAALPLSAMQIPDHQQRQYLRYGHLDIFTWTIPAGACPPSTANGTANSLMPHLPLLQSVPLRAYAVH
jgi:hypothetical protein